MDNKKAQLTPNTVGLNQVDGINFCKNLSQTEVNRGYIKLTKTFANEIKKGSLTAKIKEKTVQLHIDKYGRLHIGFYLFAELDKRKKTTVLISKEASLYKFRVTQEE